MSNVDKKTLTLKNNSNPCKNKPICGVVEDIRGGGWGYSTPPPSKHSKSL